MQGSILSTTNTNQQFLAEKLRSKNFLQKMSYFKGNNRILYDFSDPANIPIFNELASIFEDTDYTTMALKKCRSTIGYSAPALAVASTPAVVTELTPEQRHQQIMLKQREYKEILTQEKERIMRDVEKLGDNLEVTFEGQQSAVKFSDFKSELMKIAESSIQKITINSQLTDEKKNKVKIL